MNKRHPIYQQKINKSENYQITALKTCTKPFIKIRKNTREIALKSENDPKTHTMCNIKIEKNLNALIYMKSQQQTYNGC